MALVSLQGTICQVFFIFCDAVDMPTVTEMQTTELRLGEVGLRKSWQKSLHRLIDGSRPFCVGRA